MNGTKSSGVRNAAGTKPQQNDTEEHSHEDAKYAVIWREWADRADSHNRSGEVASRPLGGPVSGGASLNLQRWYHEPNDHQPYNAVGAVRMPANGVADDGSGLCGSVETSRASRASRRVEPSEADKEAKG